MVHNNCEGCFVRCGDIFYRLSFRNCSDFCCILSFMLFTACQSMGAVKSWFFVSLRSIMRLCRLNIFSSESKRALPRFSFVITQNGLLYIIENTQPWNESVSIICASAKARSHWVGGGTTRSFMLVPRFNNHISSFAFT